MKNFDIVRRSCRFCGAEIPPARLKALPDTLICVKCSERKGGSTGKAGSLKRTGQDVEVRRKPKPLK